MQAASHAVDDRCSECRVEAAKWRTPAAVVVVVMAVDRRASCSMCDAACGGWLDDGVVVKEYNGIGENIS
jgi:hypothetical protein